MKQKLKHLHYQDYQELAEAVDNVRSAMAEACHVADRHGYVRPETVAEVSLNKLATRANKFVYCTKDLFDELSDDMGIMLAQAKEVCK